MSSTLAAAIANGVTMFAIGSFILGYKGIVKAKPIHIRKNWDHVDIGYINETQSASNTNDLPKKKTKKKKKNKSRKKPNKNRKSSKVRVSNASESPIAQDCILALKALGVPTSTAKSDVKKFFIDYPEVDTVEGFLRSYV